MAAMNAPLKKHDEEAMAYGDETTALLRDAGKLLACAIERTIVKPYEPPVTQANVVKGCVTMALSNAHHELFGDNARTDATGEISRILNAYDPVDQWATRRRG